MVDWTLITDAASSNAFATAINGTSRAFSGLTAPGSAINYAAPLFTGNGFEGARWVIDVSGDGSQNDGANTPTARNNFLAIASGSEGLTKGINGLAIDEVNSTIVFDWYNANIQGGANAFVIAANFNNFSSAVATKIGREITVPEPSVLALLGLGLAGLGFMRRRKA